MEFKKYSEIENTYRQKTIDLIKEGGLEGGEWEVSNKIHGANFSIWYDGDTVRFAKRTSLLEEGENFYNVNSIKDRLETYAKSVWKKFRATEIVIYGELFGGSYPDIKSKTKAVQKGVYYSPELQFYAFDLKVNGRYIDTDQRVGVFNEAEVPYSPILLRGSFVDCLHVDPVFEDPTYEDFDLPKIENNLSEGVVIKPCEPKFFGNGSRVILKNKNPKFGEKKKKEKVKKVLAPEVEEQIANISQFITENRLKNVLSKIGEVTQKDFGKIIKEFNQDIFTDYLKEYEEGFNILDKSDGKEVTSRSNKMAAELLRSNFLNITDGLF